MRWYKKGENLNAAEVAELTNGKNEPGWYTSKAGELVYICDGCHKDGASGFKVLDKGGLK